jgi:hypothetical protein
VRAAGPLRSCVRVVCAQGELQDVQSDVHALALALSASGDDLLISQTTPRGCGDQRR